MPKKKGKSTSSNGGLGRALIRDKFGASKRTRDNPTSALHVADFDKDAAKDAKLRSVVEQNDLTELLTMATLADRDFTAERESVAVVSLGSAATDKMKKPPLPPHMAALRIPRRPAWNEDTTPDELDRLERESFVDWRRSLAEIDEAYNVELTPFERNLEVWKQLWRVVERSDVLCQILDSRNPLLYRSVDLEIYCREVSRHKRVVLLLNKADLLSAECRQLWAEYFRRHNIAFIFFSAMAEQEKLDREIEQDSDYNTDSEEPQGEIPTPDDDVPADAMHVCSASELLGRLSKLATTAFAEVDSHHPKAQPTIGFLGYPNVGKSSTLNVLCGTTRVAVGATPGKTKHFQTINLPQVTLCDCPGLVFPSVVASKAEMIVGGILPIDQIRGDHSPPVQLVCHRIPTAVLEKAYGLVLPPVTPEYPFLGARELLQAHAYARGMMTKHGAPDEARSARLILKDYVRGKLLHCVLPPGADPAPARALAASRVGLIDGGDTVVADSRQPRKLTAGKFLERSEVAIEDKPHGQETRADLVRALTAGGKKKFKGKMIDRAAKAKARAEFQGRVAFPGQARVTVD